ncbi:MAG: hypothetical protein CVU81_00405 [Euryarchaeota archaeon HGW-Euryarchaeota-1]|nr:MAG: hypothetical protein CVU81_00405 [Euryarchaeota archaeon HGW-Euryarchaeota-1]
MSKEEEKLYPEIKEWLQNYLTDKYKGYTVQTTYETSRRNLDVVLKSKGIQCKEAIGLQIKVDVVGILKRGNEFKLVFVEVKDTDLTLKDLGQLWGYTQLIDPIESFLVSSKGLGRLSHLFNVLKREDVLKFGTKTNKFMQIAIWDKRKKGIAYSSLVPKI